MSARSAGALTVLPGVERCDVEMVGSGNVLAAI
jgi:hypothetical protein